MATFEAGIEACLPGCASIDLRQESACDAALLIHGYTGYPAELAFVAAALHEAGLRVYAPRLPGHGSDRADFTATGAHDWKRRCFDAYMDLRSAHRRVHVVGHSMGGLLALHCGARFDAASLSILAPALALRDRLIALTPLLGYVAPIIKRGNAPSPEDSQGERLLLHEAYRQDSLVRQAGQLELLRRATLRLLGAVRAPVLALFADGDAAVDSPRAAARLSAGLSHAKSLTIETLQGASHLFPFEDSTKQLCAARLRDWITHG
jgi:carboxylesterase